MLRIRDAQMQTFQQAAMAAFETRMVEHLRTYFPWHYRMWGPDTTRNVVRYGMQKAQGYGLTTERHICLYLTLMATLGGNFDIDPQLPWASAVLADTAAFEPTARIDRLTAQAMEFLDRTVGKNDHYLNRALLRVRNELSELIADPSYPDLPTHALAMLERIFPQKYHAVGESRLRELVTDGVRRAGDYGMTARPGQLIFIGLMFMFGSGFDRDPQLPDYALILKSPNFNAQEKADKLQQLALDYVEKWITWTTAESHNG
ncbi:MAG TPA: hypothetical protein VNN62_01960 [Methylomirabilota bacterium]|nr:hypothetical protein [Methylomirabilota bacterium]